MAPVHALCLPQYVSQSEILGPIDEMTSLRKMTSNNMTVCKRLKQMCKNWKTILKIRQCLASN